MNEQEMSGLYTALETYRAKEFKRSGYFRHPDMGTYITFHIGDYDLVCHFFVDYNSDTKEDYWTMRITVRLKQFYGDHLYKGEVFTDPNTLRIPDTIDRLIKAIQKMPPVIDTLIKQFDTILKEVE